MTTHEITIHPTHLTYDFHILSLFFLLTSYAFRATTCLMASSGSSPESHRPHRRRDLGRTSRSRDTRHIEEVDYDADDNTPLPSINPPPGTEIARGLPVPDPPQPSDTVAGDTSHQTTTSHRTVSGPPLTPRPHHSQFPFPRPHSPPAFPPTPPTHLTGPPFPPPRVQVPRPRPPLSHPRATGPPPHNPYAPRPAPGNHFLPATIALRGQHAPLLHGNSIGDVPIPGAALPTLADRVNIDADHL